MSRHLLASSLSPPLLGSAVADGVDVAADFVKLLCTQEVMAYSFPYQLCRPALFAQYYSRGKREGMVPKASLLGFLITSVTVSRGILKQPNVSECSPW